MSEIRSIKPDPGQWRNYVCVSGPELRTEFGTGEVRTDRESGKPLYVVGIAVRSTTDRKAYILDVTVVGEPVGLVEGELVVIHNLVATPWHTETGNGISFRADAITPAKPITAPASASGIAAAASGEAAAGPGRSARGGGGS